MKIRMRKRQTSRLGLSCLGALLLVLGDAAGAANASLQSRLAQAEQRLLRLEDEEAINKLTRAYGYYIDKQVWDEVIPLFADDAAVEISGRGVYRGARGVRTLFHDVIGRGHDGLAAGTLSNHMVLQGIVNVDPNGDTARGRWRAFIQIGVYQQAALWAEGTYEITYIKTGGIWKFHTMHWYGTYFTPFDQGWAKAALANNATSQAFPPNEPPSVQYDSFPGHYVPPFDYPNPVTGRVWSLADTERYSTHGSNPGTPANATGATAPAPH